MSDIFDHELDAYLSRDEDDDEYGWDGVQRMRRTPTPPTCKYCGTKDLRWVKLETGWRLFSPHDKTIHTCSMEKR